MRGAEGVRVHGNQVQSMAVKCNQVQSEGVRVHADVGDARGIGSAEGGAVL